MAAPIPAAFDDWLRALEELHLADLRFVELSRALRSLSAGYVERRERLGEKSAFDGAGKRAAYAMFYAPLHFLTVTRIVHAIPGAADPLDHIADWGCGTGAAGAAWSSAMSPQARVSGIDAHPWTLREAARTYSVFGIHADVRPGDVARARIPASARGLVAGWVMNEIGDRVRAQLLPKLLVAAARGTRVLIVEPIATRMSPWWPEWADAITKAGGRADEWRFAAGLPPLLHRLDCAAGLRHDELTARSLWLAR